MAQKLGYSPRWLYWLLDRLNALRIQPWIIATGFVAIVGLLRHWIAWKSGLLPAGGFSALLAFNPVFIVAYPLAWIFLDRKAETALRRFYSDTKLSQSAFESKLRDFVSIPELPATLFFLVGIAMGFAGYKAGQSASPLSGRVLPVIDMLAFILGNAFPAMMGYRIFLNIVRMRKMFAETKADIFNPGRIYALSRYAATFALVFLLLTFGLSIISLPNLLNTTFGVAVQIGIFPMVFALFFAPLSQINLRMREEKERLLSQIGSDQKEINAKLHNAIADKQFKGLSDLRNAVSVLKEQRDVIQKLPTWPWEQDTFRNLFLPLLIPVFVYLVQRFLGGLLGL
jgi:hypothetical protein